MSIPTTLEVGSENSVRELIDPEAFAAVAWTVKDNNPGMASEMAERITEQGLAFVAACAATTGQNLKPSRVVDEGWHALILHTELYAELCENLGGRFIHHRPERPDVTRHDPEALDRTQAAIAACGYFVDTDLWSGPADGSITVSASCEHSGCNNPAPCTSPAGCGNPN